MIRSNPGDERKTEEDTIGTMSCKAREANPSANNPTSPSAVSGGSPETSTTPATESNTTLPKSRWQNSCGLVHDDSRAVIAKSSSAANRINEEQQLATWDKSIPTCVGSVITVGLKGKSFNPIKAWVKGLVLTELLLGSIFKLEPGEGTFTGLSVIVTFVSIILWPLINQFPTTVEKK